MKILKRENESAGKRNLDIMTSQLKWSLLVLLLVAILADPTWSFVPSCRNPNRSHSRFNFLSLSTKNDNDDYSATETQEMRDLILSLSLEPTDHDRRSRVRDVFHEALARPNGMPKRFTDLFDKVLIEVGDQVQNEAKKKFFEDEAAAAAAQKSDPKESSSAGEDESLLPTERIKSPEELQLWALVDMMVQTKTIVKKVNGELGSQGTFQ